MPPKLTLRRLVQWLDDETEEESEWSQAVGEDKERRTEKMVQELKEKLDMFEFTNKEETLLHRLLGRPEAAKNCPEEIWKLIIAHSPEAILAVFDTKIPLEQAISHGLSIVVNLMIGYLEHEQSLSFKDYKSEGIRCIKAAFNFYSGDRRLLPISMDLIQRLVTLATPEMLSNRGDVIPLHQAIRYELGVQDPKGQYQLVKTLLDKREDTVNFMIEAGSRFNEPQQEIMAPKDMSSFRWHLWSRDNWMTTEKKRVNSNVRTLSEIEPVAKDMEEPRSLERRTSFATHALRARTPGRPQGMMYKTARESGPPAISVNPRDKDEGSDVKETENLAEKDDGRRQQRPMPSSMSKSNNDTKGKLNAGDAIKAGEEASKSVCAELTRRFLWSTLATSPDEIARANGSQNVIPVWSEIEGRRTATTIDMFFGRDGTDGEDSNGKLGKDVKNWSTHPPSLGLFLL